MKKQLFLIAGIAVFFRTYACDVCGCSLGGFSQGIMPDYNSHFAGVRYNFAQFHALIDHSSLNQESEESTDTYQRIDFVARYNINRRLKLNVDIPFLMNNMEGTHQTIHTSGVGDPTALVYYQLLKEEQIQKNHFLLIGGGLKFPLGKYDLEDNGALVNRNFQLGTGSLDFVISGNYFHRKNKSGFMIETAYKLNTSSKSGYRFGNQFNLAASYLFIHTKNMFNFLFFGGFYFEQAARHTEKQTPVLNTGGTAFFANTGVQYYIKKLRLSTGIQYPLVQNYQTDNLTAIQAGVRFSADVVFFFGKR